MDRQVVIDRLSSNKASLRALGLARVSLFGSTARGQSSEATDIDLAVTLGKNAKFNLFEFAALSEKVARLLGSPVDLIVDGTLREHMKENVDREAVRAF